MPTGLLSRQVSFVLDETTTPARCPYPCPCPRPGNVAMDPRTIRGFTDTF